MEYPVHNIVIHRAERIWQEVRATGNFKFRLVQQKTFSIFSQKACACLIDLHQLKHQIEPESYSFPKVPFDGQEWH